ncbi:MAG: ROK family protein, partial [Candidatus Spechtbacteria bacterium]|nr:ROK family protein [Candidatus Spechtbacteria bacterium]
GVGGGLVIDCAGTPMLWDGYHGSAAEVGHMILDVSGSARVGKPFSFEQLCSSRAVHFWKDGDALAVEKKARKGDKAAQDVYDTFGFWVGIGVANIVNVVDPEVVVIGGSIAKAWDLFEKNMYTSAEKYIVSSAAKKVKIVRAKLGDDAGAIGAAYLLN